jgi:hypothetical protein
MEQAEMTSMPRRAFLKAMAVAPVAAQSGAVKALIAKVEAATAMTAAGVQVGMPAMGGYGAHLLGNKGLYAAFKMGLLPGWARSEIEQHVRDQHSRQLSPDLAALRSVSLAAKCRMQTDRAINLFWKQADDFHVHSVARDAFWAQPENRPSPPSF